jgi:hypothetical protein
MTSIILHISNIPTSLQTSISAALNQTYAELYEKESSDGIFLEDTLTEILTIFRESSEPLFQLRCVWMAMILSSAVEPTLKKCQPRSNVPDVVINYLSAWIIGTTSNMVNNGRYSSELLSDISETFSENLRNTSFPTENISSLQIFVDSLETYVSSVKTLNSSQSFESLLEILDYCLEGYAIFPGSQGRRQLFNWWLLDVVPSAWYFVIPETLFAPTMDRDTVRSSALTRLKKNRNKLVSTLLKPKLYKPSSREDFKAFNTAESIENYSLPTKSLLYTY